MYADVCRKVLPITLAQDASGGDAGGFGGWGLGFAFPPGSEVVAVTLQAIGRGIPRDVDLRADAQCSCDWQGSLNDSHIPSSWTNGAVTWHELPARAHSYTRRSYALALEDNAVVMDSFSKGRSPKYAMCRICRRKAALDGGSQYSTRNSMAGHVSDADG